MRNLAVLFQLLRTPSVLKRVVKSRLSSKQRYFHNMVSGRRIQLLVLVVTRRCNMYCQMCMQDHNAHNQEETNRIDIDDYRKLLGEVKAWDPVVQLTGGEPFMYKKIDVLINAIKENNLFCMINTNGSMLKNYAELIVKSRVEKVTVSIDGSPEVHNRIRNFDRAYDLAISGIQALAQEKIRHRSPYPFIDVKSVIIPANNGKLEPVVALLNNGFIQMVDFVHMWFLHKTQVQLFKSMENNNGLDYYPPHDFPLFTHEELEDAMKHVRGLQRRYKYKPFIVFPDIPDDLMCMYYEKPEKLLYRNRCVYPYETARVLPNGDILACPEDIAVKSVLGNLRDMNFTDIIRGEAAQKFFKKLDSAGGAWPVCTRCCGIFR